MISQALLAAFLLLQGTTPPAAPKTYKISGTVTREDGQPAAQVSTANQIRFAGPNTSIIRIADDGTFQFPNAQPGTYRIVVGPTITMEEVPVTVTDTDVTGVRLFVPSASVLATPRVAVTVDGGGPRPRFQMTFTKVNATPGSVPFSLPVSAATSSAQMAAGEYRIAAAGLPPGYSIRSMNAGSADLLTQTFKINASESPQIDVALGVSTPPPWVKVSGRISNSSGSPGTSVTMTAAAILAETLSSPLNPDGSFEIPRALPGTYTVRVAPASSATPTITLVVGSTDLTSVNIVLPGSKEITGHVVIEGEGPAPRVAAFSMGTVPGSSTPAPAAAAPAGTVTIGASSGSTSVAVQPDGSFKIPLLEGERSISLVPSSIPKGYVVKSVTYGSMDLLKNPIRVSATDTAELKITLDSTPVTLVKVSGRVVGLGAAVPVGTVTLAGSSSIVTDANGVSSIVSSGSLDTPLNPDGTFVFPKVIAGNYTARFSGPGISGSTAVVVADKEISGVEIALPKDTVGRVVVEGGGPAPRMVLPLTLISTAAGAPAAGTTNMSITPQVDGGFRVALPNGERRVGAPTGLPAGYSVKSIMYGSTDLLKDTLKVAAGDSAELVITLATSGATQFYSVSGKVTGLPAAATRGATIVLQGSAIGAGHETPLKPDGSFTFDKLFPGSYSARLSLSGIQVGTSFSVTNKDVTGVTINYARTYNVAAHVIVEGAATGAIPPAVVFEAKRPDGQTVSPSSIGNGMWQLTLATGANTVSVRSVPAGYQLKSVMYGTTDLLKEPVIMDGPVVWEIVARLTPAGR